MPFSSRRRWSASASAATATCSARRSCSRSARSPARPTEARAGPPRRRVRHDAPLPDAGRAAAAGLARSARRARRASCARTRARRSRASCAQGVELKVLSGDAPETVAAIARDAGIPSAPALDGRRCPRTGARCGRSCSSTSVIGRISPEGKRRVVEALATAGRYVAMVGDGVNDVPALKAARLAIAQGAAPRWRAASPTSCSSAATSPRCRPWSPRAGKSCATSSASRSCSSPSRPSRPSSILSIGLTPTAYPLLPRHLTLAASLTIGIPRFFLALAPSAGAYRLKGFLRDIGRFAIPAGTAAGLGVLSSYLFALDVLDLSLVESRTVAATVLLARRPLPDPRARVDEARRGAWVGALCGVLGGLTCSSWSFRSRATSSPSTSGAAVLARRGRRRGARDRWTRRHGRPLHPGLGAPPLGRHGLEL